MANEREMEIEPETRDNELSDTELYERARRQVENDYRRYIVALNQMNFLEYLPEESSVWCVGNFLSSEEVVPTCWWDDDRQLTLEWYPPGANSKNMVVAPQCGYNKEKQKVEKCWI